MLLWLAQPPLGIWPIVFVALVPWICVIESTKKLQRRDWAMLLAASTGYWLLSLQGLRFAHPLMFIPWIALSIYLALYHLIFIWIARRLADRKVALMISVPVAWVTTELMRNYLLTGISVLMLGHHLADVPTLIQIADLQGTYAVSFLIALVNVAATLSFKKIREGRQIEGMVLTSVISVAMLCLTCGYGFYRLSAKPGQSLATFALLQRDQQVDYGHSLEREIEMFQNYGRQAISAANQSPKSVDAIVWPESMYSGGAPWMFLEDDFKVPEESIMGRVEFREAVLDRQQYIEVRNRSMLSLIERNGERPAILGGCGVQRFGESTDSYSAVVHADSSGKVVDWYGKTHLVMFGEYIPVIPWLPIAKDWVPRGMGLATGKNSKRFQILDTIVSPNICIETAVERVTINQIGSDPMKPADVVVTVTNDGWFDDSSVIEHHLRCVQLVAAGCRRPVLSAANNGPTAWIDDRGRIVKKLDTGAEGTIIATPRASRVTSIYCSVGDIPTRLLAAACLVCVLLPSRLLPWKNQKADSSENPSDVPTPT